MRNSLENFYRQVNFTRYQGQKGGLYESFYQRANHPSKPLAFWIRYTIFSPKGRPQDAIGELWAVYFDGEKRQNIAVKQEFPFSKCNFSNDKFYAKINQSVIKPGQMKGGATLNKNTIEWNLKFSNQEKPVLVFPLSFYQRKFPAAKVITSAPLANYNGELNVNGKKVLIKNWIGSQCHNWGWKHTDEYAQVQVCGFDNSPDTFLEAATARLKIGPVYTPTLTPLVLRHQGEEYAINGLLDTVLTKASYRFFDWNFKTENSKILIEGKVQAQPENFVCLTYYNPPGGNKHCLNSKIARCELKIKFKDSGKEEILIAKNRALFEILTDKRDHGIEVAV